MHVQKISTGSSRLMTGVYFILGFYPPYV